MFSRLQIAVCNSMGMYEADGVQNLEESVLGQTVIADESSLFGDIGKEVSFRAEFHDHKGTVRTVEDANQ